jgi:hypothetical protein
MENAKNTPSQLERKYENLKEKYIELRIAYEILEKKYENLLKVNSLILDN